MKNKNHEADRNYLIIYFVLTFVIAWSVWIPAGIFTPGNQLFVLPGAWAPTFAALILVGFTEGKKGIRRLLKSLIKWRVKFWYYIIAILSVLGVALLAIGIHIFVGGSWPDLGSIASRFGFTEDQTSLFLLFSPVIYITTIFVGGPIAEELGWRGYAQPRLQSRIGAGLAGVVIGLIWSLWHLPLFFYFPAAVGGLTLSYYIPLVTAIGVLFAWLYNRTGGSVLLCILLHAGVNFAIGIIGSDILTGDTRLLTIFVVLMGVLALILFQKIRSVRNVD